MARSLVGSGNYRVSSRLEQQTEYHPPDDVPKLIAAVFDVETTGTDLDHDKIIELGICLFEYDRQSGRIYRVLGSHEWFEDPGLSIPSEITKITGITDEMVAGHRIDDSAVNDLLSQVVLVIAHNADFDRRFLEKRLLLSLQNIGRVAAPISIGRQRASVHRRLNSSPIHWGSFTTAIGPRVTVVPPFMPWRNGYPVPGGWHCWPCWDRRECRRGACGRGMPSSKRRTSSRPAVTHGAQEIMDDRNAGIAMCRTRKRRQRRLGSAQM